ncbi:uncharacterized protein TRIVIDRAFT_58560 [Trichoderma virens Gv29-8]|uniref:Uncharacterized protein n=1 Tax=Hypocrea virens (strain Gv29-8 / FGSC 10586) TaxID=413071 RepID=G9MZM2_HYPVG|nr:uncharacterized protein TRIVIDRAFT_58560 [Trichoderma virens Gv29-8]EHK20078.1 hypothetical protein TRIVIDRAFT_58560 [Trichoderma virens Gv29-8]UKZ45979.1 hypothetical protein TrVGV298_000175 [Trichoderma virens]
MGSRPVNFGAVPTVVPRAPSRKLQYADVAVTATAKEFAGVYRDKQYHAPDFECTLDRALDASVSKVLLTGMRLADVASNAAIARSRPSQCFITAGVHPYHALEIEQGGQDYLQRLAGEVHALRRQSPSPLAAFGELGLDYDRLQYAGKETQREAFKAQLDLYVSEKFDLPLFLHCRSAFEDFVEIITPYTPLLRRRGLVHSFVGSTDQMQKLVELGFDISVNAFSFSDEESLKMVADVPLHRLQIETDSPWGYLPDASELVKRYCANASQLPLAKKRNKWESRCMVKERNESCMIERIAFIVAGLKGITIEEVADRAWENSIQMFSLERS